MNKQRWSKEEVLKVAKEYGEKGALVLSSEMDRPPQAIRGMVTRLRKSGVKIPREPLQTSYRDAVAELLEGQD